MRNPWHKNSSSFGSLPVDAKVRGMSVRLFFCLLVFLAVINGLKWGGRSGRSRRPTRLRSSLSGISEMFRRSPQQDAGGAGPSTSRSRAGPSRSRSRSRSSSPDLKILDSPPRVFREQLHQQRQQQPFRVPLSKVNGGLTASSDNDVRLLDKFREISQNEGELMFSEDDIELQKMALLQKARTDLCNDAANRRRAGNDCALAFVEFMKIPKPWRGPCKEAFMGWCQPWGSRDAPVWKCSFFIKTSESSDGRSVAGYSHTMEDCAGRLSPEQFHNDWINAIS
ncbi:uncharacterized protein [Bemisia tabaci]